TLSSTASLPASARPWAANYPKDVPLELGPLEFESIPQMLEFAVKRFGPRPAFESFGVQLTFEMLDRLSQQFAAFLQHELGLQRGDRVAVMMPNILQYPVTVFGILRAGMTVVSVNPLYTSRELEHQLRDSDSAAIVIFESAAHTLQAVLANTPVRHVVVASLGDMLGLVKGGLLNFVFRRVKKMVPAWRIDGARRFPEALSAGARHRFTPLEVRRDELAFLQYTGGTTGVSKGAMLQHRHVLANVQQVRTYFGEYVKEGEEVAIAPLPFYHILALVMNCMMGVRLGSLEVLIANPRDIPRLIKTLAKSRFTFFVGVNTLFNALINHPDFVRVDFSRLRVSGGGGAPVQLSVAKRWKEITGHVLSEGYGLTETAGAVSINPPNIEAHTGTTGFPVPSTDVEIRDEAGNVLPQGQTGQVFVRGPQVMAGYWRRPEETARAIDPNGFFATGDVGLITPEGYLRIVDRVKDMILVSGFNVYPNELEEVVAMHPGVLEAAAVGIPDEASGEAVKLFIVRRDPALTSEQVLEHCRANLTGYKVPRIIEFRDALPKSPVGKILRRELRDGRS
ncbi:MAG TPA: AMP-binding protein, partial [Burkholderiales bacterium]|nr:AMP-binding protein [Burkholderiales bacterium]